MVSDGMTDKLYNKMSITNIRVVSWDIPVTVLK